MNGLLPALVFLPAAAAPVSYVLGRRSRSLRDGFVAFFCLLELILALLLLFFRGAEGWALPGFCSLGISLSGEGLGVLLALLAALGWLSATLMLREYFAHARNRNRYYFFWLLTLSGTVGVFLSADLFTTFIFFELMSFASWVMVIHTEKPEALKASETYLAVAVIGGLVTLMGLFLLNRQLGTLCIDELYEASRPLAGSGALRAAGLLTLVGFAAKAGSFPLHIWLPTAHPAAPAPASAVLSGVIIKTGVFGILVLSCQVFRHDGSWGMRMLVLGLVTMLLGAVLAVFSLDLKRTLACSSVSQIGFILVGVAMQCLLGEHNALAVDGTLLHIVNHASIKLILFPAAGVIYCSTHGFDLNHIRGFGHNKPWLAVLMLLPMASLAGLPGLNGYVSKTLLHESIVEYIHLVPETAGLFTAVEWLFLLAGGLTCSYMLKLFVCIFVEKPSNPCWEKKSSAALLSMLTLSALAALLPLMGLLPHGVMGAFAAMGRGFMAGHAPEHAVHYFAWVNLKGSLLSLAIGAALYLLAVRPLLSRRAEGGRYYLSRWPERLNLESGLYRPLLCRVLPFAGTALARLGEELVERLSHVLPFVGAVIARLAEGLVEGLTALLSEGLYFRQSRDVQPSRDGEFAAYKEKPRPYLGFRYSLACSIMLVGIGLSLALIFVLMMGV